MHALFKKYLFIKKLNFFSFLSHFSVIGIGTKLGTIFLTELSRISELAYFFTFMFLWDINLVSFIIFYNSCNLFQIFFRFFWLFQNLKNTCYPYFWILKKWTLSWSVQILRFSGISISEIILNTSLEFSQGHDQIYFKKI